MKNEWPRSALALGLRRKERPASPHAISRILLLLPYPQVPPPALGSPRNYSQSDPDRLPDKPCATRSCCGDFRLLRGTQPFPGQRRPLQPLLASPKAHPKPGRSTSCPGCAEGTAPQSGGSGARRCGGRGGRASHRWRSWGCWGPGSRSGPSWLPSVRCSWSAPRRGWCWYPAGRALCRSASPAASGEDRARAGLEGPPEGPQSSFTSPLFPKHTSDSGAAKTEVGKGLSLSYFDFLHSVPRQTSTSSCPVHQSSSICEAHFSETCI